MAITDAVISLLKEGHEDFELANQGSINKYLGLLTRDMDTNTFKMSQPILICRILDFLLLDKNKTNGQVTLFRKLCSNVTWMVFLRSTCGYIVEELVCSLILLKVFDLRFKRQCIKLLIS